MEISARIKQLRLENDLTQEELGKKIGVKKSAIQKYENGTIQNLKKATILQLSEIFQVSPIFLMGWEDLNTVEEDSIYYMDEGDQFMSKYPPEARKELETFLAYLNHKYGLDNQ